MSERPYTINLDLCRWCKRTGVSNADLIYEDGVRDGQNTPHSSRMTYCDTLLDIYQQGIKAGRTSELSTDVPG